MLASSRMGEGVLAGAVFLRTSASVCLCCMNGCGMCGCGWGGDQGPLALSCSSTKRAQDRRDWEDLESATRRLDSSNDGER